MIGKTLAHYEITGLLGKGGMGEVYRARDTRLERDVALKVLPGEFVADEERLARFRREAKVLASLNHPNVATLHGFEVEGVDHFLVMELVEGEDLAQRIARGSIPLDEALPFAAQIAEGLEAAHEKRIIHRDLKPANIKITEEGKVKVLDFGLAKALGHDVPAIDLSQSPTLAAGPTVAGVILGTAPYMSPEQARGQEVDKQTDVWAFGCVLYEMLTGERPFPGETPSEVMAAVLEREPDWSALPTGAPIKIRDLIRRCLRKKSRERLHDIADARLEIEETLDEPRSTERVAQEAGRVSNSRYRVVIAVLAVIAALAGVLASRNWIGWQGASPGRANPARFVITLPPGLDFVGQNPFAVSRDGRALAYAAARPGETSRIYLRALDQFEARPLPGTEGGEVPFFSPDGQWVGFFGAEGRLEKIAVAGGPARRICEVPTGTRFAASWGEDGTITFVAGITEGLERVSAEGGVPQKLTVPRQTDGEIGHWYPSALPGDGGLAFSVWSLEGYSVALLSRESGSWTPLIPGGYSARGTTSGYLAYLESGALLAAPFDLDSRELRGAPIPFLDGIEGFDVSNSGLLVYRELAVGARLMSIDRSGGEARILSEAPERYVQPRFSPDGRRLAVSVAPTQHSDVWVFDLDRGSKVRLTSEGAVNNSPIWSPDGSRIAFNSARSVPGIYSIPSNGGGSPELLWKRETTVRLPASWSLDGRWIALVEMNRETGTDLWLLEMGEGGSSTPFLVTPFEEHSPKFSPDGRWIAYVSNESGREEVYARPFPGPGGKWTLSTAGGSEPVWSSDGSELYYRSPEGMMGIPVDTSGALRAGKPRVLLDDTFQHHFLGVANYDVAPESGRFVMVEPNQESSGPAQLKVVLNWTEELERLAGKR